MKVIKKRSILIYLMGFVVARATFFQMNPLVIGFFTAAYLQKAGGGILFVILLAGLGSAMAPSMILKYLLTMITSIVIIEAPFMKKRVISQPLLYSLPSLVLLLFSFMEAASSGWELELIVLALLETIIAFVAGAVFKSGTDFLLNEAKGYRINNEQSVSLAFLIAVIIYAFPDFGIKYIAPVETVVYFIILLFTYKYGVGQGTVAGAVSGFALSLRGAPVAGIGMLTMMGIVPAVFREMGRVPTATIFSITAAVIGLVYDEMALQTREIGALVSAIMIFLLLPRSLTNRIDSDGSLDGRDALATQNIRKIANTKMRIFSDSFMKLSKTLNAITERQTKLQQQEINYIFEEISEKLCKSCINCSKCWEHNFSETYQNTCQIFEVAEKNGFIQKEEVPTKFLSNCICADQFIMETNRGFEIAKLKFVWNNRMAESREVIADQLKEVSTVIQDITSDIYTTEQALRLEEEKVYKRLKSEHIQVKNVAVIERNDKRKEIYLCASAARGSCITAKETAAIISDALGFKIKVSEASKTVLSKDYDNYIFEEDTKFKVLNGVARAMKDNISGDNFSLVHLETGEFMLALSDGMGTGKEAGEESETVLALLEQLLEAGFKSETAIKLINSSLVLKADKQSFSTIDMGMINLFTGMCEFIKIGAAATFIKRDNWVETISSTTLPIGMFGNVDYDTVTKKLYEGDIIIMVTDGVLDSIQEENKEAYMERLIIELKSNNPQEIANRILDNTLAQSNYVPMDDMTVIAAGIWLK